MAIAPDPRPVAQRPVDRLAQADAHVLGRVMPVNMQVARAGDRQVHQRMAGEQLEHVVEEPDPRRDLGPPLAVQVELQADVGLASLAHDLGDCVEKHSRSEVLGDTGKQADLISPQVETTE